MRSCLLMEKHQRSLYSWEKINSPDDIMSQEKFLFFCMTKKVKPVDNMSQA